MITFLQFQVENKTDTIKTAYKCLTPTVVAVYLFQHEINITGSCHKLYTVTAVILIFYFIIVSKIEGSGKMGWETWWRFRLKGHGFDSHSSQPRRDLGQVLHSQLPMALRREIPAQYPCCVGSASE